MKKNILIEWLNDRRIVVGIVIIIVICTSYCLTQISKTKSLRLLKDTFTIEYGKEISTDCKEYLHLVNMQTTSKEDIYKNAKFSIDKNIQKEYPDIGEYMATIVYKEECIRFPIIVQDTTPPSFAPIEDITVEIETILSSEEIRNKFIVTDLQSVKVEVDEGGYDGTKLGKYTIKAIARDASGNIANASYCITVEKQKEAVDDKETISIDEKRSSNTNAINEQVDWWASLSNQGIKDKVISSLIWKNEWTGVTYHGLDGLTYGFNIEDKAYGGLVLLENPYNAQIDFGFYGGPYCQTYADTFSLYWQAPRGPGREVDCGKVKINIPKAITGEELYTYYH